MSTDAYVCCLWCGHVVAIPTAPIDNECENCNNHGSLVMYATLDEAEERSERVVEHNDRVYTDQLEARRKA